MKAFPFPWNFELNCWGVGGWESSRLLGHMGKEDLSLKLVGYPDCCFSHSEPPWSRVSHPILLILCFQLDLFSKVQEALAIFQPLSLGSAAAHAGSLHLPPGQNHLIRKLLSKCVLPLGLLCTLGVCPLWIESVKKLIVGYKLRDTLCSTLQSLKTVVTIALRN